MAERVTQLYLEYDYGEPPAIRATQLYVEYDWQQAPPAIRATQLYLEYDWQAAAVGGATRCRAYIYG